MIDEYLLKTEAIMLKCSPFSKTSAVGTWLSYKFGLLNTVMKGAYRIKGDFLGQHDLFYTCEIIFYPNRYAIHIAKECSVLNPRQYIRKSLKATVCASYMCYIVTKISGHGGNESKLYILLNSALDTLNSSVVNNLMIPWFELKSAQIQGIGPQFNSCAICRNEIKYGMKYYYFSPKGGGILCEKCCNLTKYPLFKVTESTVNILKQLEESSSSCPDLQLSKKQILEINHIMGLFCEYYMDISPKSRLIVNTVLSLYEKANNSFFLKTR